MRKGENLLKQVAIHVPIETTGSWLPKLLKSNGFINLVFLITKAVLWNSVEAWLQVADFGLKPSRKRIWRVATFTFRRPTGSRILINAVTADSFGNCSQNEADQRGRSGDCPRGLARAGREALRRKSKESPATGRIEEAKREESKRDRRSGPSCMWVGEGN